MPHRDKIESVDDRLLISQESLDLAKQLDPVLHDFCVTVRNVELVGPDHKTATEVAQKTADGFAALTGKRADIHIDTSDTCFVVDDIPIHGETEAVHDHFLRALRAAHVGRLTIHRGLTAPEITAFLGLLLANDGGRLGIIQDMRTEEVRHISLGRRHGFGDADEGSIDFEARHIGDPLKVYQVCIDVIREIHSEVLVRHAMDTAKIEFIIDNIVEQVSKQNQDLLALATIRGYDAQIHTHPLNVAIFAAFLANQFCTDGRRLHELTRAALLHDIGKFTVPSERVSDPTDWGVEHPEVPDHHLVGSRLIDQNEQLERLLVVVAYEHHMHDDGEGIPPRNDGRELNIFTSVVSLCDAFDDLLQHPDEDGRYRGLSDVIEDIAAARDEVFCSEVVDDFLMLMGRTPTGSMVRLETGAYGIVVRQAPGRPDCPGILVFTDPRGGFLNEPLQMGGGSVLDPPEIVQVVDGPEAGPYLVRYLARVAASAKLARESA